VTIACHRLVQLEVAPLLEKGLAYALAPPAGELLGAQQRGALRHRHSCKLCLPQQLLHLLQRRAARQRVACARRPAVRALDARGHVLQLVDGDAEPVSLAREYTQVRHIRLARQRPGCLLSPHLGCGEPRLGRHHLRQLVKL